MIYRGFRVIEVRLYYISIITIIVLLCFNYIKKKFLQQFSHFLNKPWFIPGNQMISIKSTILNSEEKLQKDVNKFKKFTLSMWISQISIRKLTSHYILTYHSFVYLFFI